MDPELTAAKLNEGVMEFIVGDNAYKAKVVARSLDYLIGNDPRAIVKHIRGFPADMVELVSDALIAAIEKAVLDRLNAKV